MAMHKRHMQTILMRNGHLVVTGDETTEELQLALMYLRSHTVNVCRKPHLGVAIEALIPDISVLSGKSTHSRSVKTAAIRGEKL